MYKVLADKRNLYLVCERFKTTTPGSFQMLSIARKKKKKKKKKKRITTTPGSLQILNIAKKKKKKECMMFAYYLFTPVVFLMKLLFMYSKVYLLTSSRACEWSVFWTSTDSLPSPFTAFSLRIQPSLLTLGRQGRFTGKIPSSEERTVFAGYVQRLTWSCVSVTQPRHTISAAHVT